MLVNPLVVIFPTKSLLLLEVIGPAEFVQAMVEILPSLVVTVQVS